MRNGSNSRRTAGAEYGRSGANMTLADFTFPLRRRKRRQRRHQLDVKHACGPRDFYSTGDVLASAPSEIVNWSTNFGTFFVRPVFDSSRSGPESAESPT